MTLMESKLMHNQKDQILEELKNKVIHQAEEIERLTIITNKYQVGLNLSGNNENNNEYIKEINNLKNQLFEKDSIINNIQNI